MAFTRPEYIKLLFIFLRGSRKIFGSFEKVFDINCVALLAAVLNKMFKVRSSNISEVSWKDCRLLDKILNAKIFLNLQRFLVNNYKPHQERQTKTFSYLAQLNRIFFIIKA